MSGRAWRAIDLFAGIGGIRMGFEQAFGEAVRVVFSSEWNSFSRQTYAANFRDGLPVAGDIRAIGAGSIPDFDILMAGFPCQPFSIAGVSKKQSMGRATGFADKAQGTLFFEVARIIRDRRPRAFFLENVKNLTSHDRGRTFRVIMGTLEEDLGYHVSWRVLDSRGWTCQHRERIYIVGFRDDVPFDFDELAVPGEGHVLGEILEPEVDDKYTLSDRL